MKKIYLITGATGHLGTVLVSALLKRGESVRALVLPEAVGEAPKGVQVCVGDITDPQSLNVFMRRDGCETATLVHCAARITIASQNDPRVWATNVVGTDCVMAAARSAGIDRVVYVSSVHAIPERPKGETITEVDVFSPDRVQGQYAKSKAAAAQIALDYADKGLNVSVVHPSGIIGPGDLWGNNHMVRTLRAMASGKISVGFDGGYDFVDARDVAEGILGCEAKGQPKTCYILNGHYCAVFDLLNLVRSLVGKGPARIKIPYVLAKAAAPLAEKWAAFRGEPHPLLTPYSVATLHTNGRFSHQRAFATFGYQPRDLAQSVRDALFFGKG